MNDENIITISLFYNGREYFLTINKKKTLYDLINLIINKFNINISLFDLIYDNRPLQINKMITLEELVGNIDNPPFMLRKKIYREDEKTKEMCVVIEHFPSFRDLTEQIDYFFQNVNAKNKNYDIEYKNSYCVIYFYSKEVSFAFVQYMNALKYSNDLYYKIKIKLGYPEYYTKLNNSSSIRIIKINPETKRKNDKNNLSMSKNNSANRSYIHPTNKSYLNRYYSYQKFIRNGSPYLSEEERRRIDERVNKKKWITKKGFICSIGNYSMDREIKNYVNETPSESPLKHDFRVVNKRKWMNNKGFIL